MEENSSPNVCRTCLTEEGDFQSVFLADESTGSNIHIAEMIMTYASVQITLGDELPEQICLPCAKQASSFYLFKQRCEESDSTLRNRLGKSPYTKPYSIKEEQKFMEYSYNDRDCIDIIIRPDISLEEGELKEDYGDSDAESSCEETPLEVQNECCVCLKAFANSDLLAEHRASHADIQLDKYDEDSLQEVDAVIQEINVDGDELGVESVSGDEEKCKVDEDEQVDNEFEGVVVCDSADLELKEESEYKFRCDVCGFAADCQEDLDGHDCESVRKNGLECSVCFKTFAKGSHLTRHLKIHAAVKPHVCVLCSKGFARLEQLTNHMNMHSGVKPHVCKICAKGFNQISNLKDHMRTHNGEKPFLCSTCGKGFNQLGNLRQHTIRHSGIKAHLCSICGNGFASKGELCAHLRKHTGARPFVCPVCNHGFTTSSSLTKHKRIHSGEKPYECEVCKMRFSRSGILARHKRTHTGEKPYVCKFCAKAFSQSNDLSSHLRIHTGEKPYICDTCGQAFRQSSALKTHKKTHMDRSSMLDSRVVIGMVHTTFFNSLQ